MKQEVFDVSAEMGSDIQSTGETMPPPEGLGIANIAVVGVGGGGGNIVRRLAERPVTGVTFICVNTDVKALQGISSNVVRKVTIGRNITKGFGAGGDVEAGRAAIVSDRASLEEMLADRDIVFITAGLGGGTGTGAAPVVAEVARETGAMTVGMVTLPFSWEGRKRLETAIGGLSRLREKADNLILVHNDRLTRMVPEEVTMQEALKLADEAVAQGILVVVDIMNVPGDINVDLADIKTVLGYPGASLMAIGEGSGPKGVQVAVQSALQNPLLDLSINGAKGVLFAVRGGSDVTLHQVNEAGRTIAKAVDPQAVIFFGLNIDPEMENKFRLTILATGIPEKAS